MKKTLFALSAPLLLATAAHAQEKPTTPPALAPKPPVREIQPRDGKAVKIFLRDRKVVDGKVVETISAKVVVLVTSNSSPRNFGVPIDPQKNVPIDPQFNKNRSTGPYLPHGATPFKFNDKTHYYVPIQVDKQEK